MNIAVSFFYSLTLCLAICSLSYGDTCVSPEVKSKVYSTTEAQMSTETVVIVQFELACKNKPRELNLYAEFNGRTSPASQAINSDKFQVSFSEDHKKLPAGMYTVRFFDDDLYADLRRAQRSGEDTLSVKSLFEVTFEHQGASEGPWIQTEHIAVISAVLVSYLAHTARSYLLS